MHRIEARVPWRGLALAVVATASSACIDEGGGGRRAGDNNGDGDVPASCSDGVLNGTDLCDGEDVGSRTCADEGFAGGGVLGCNDTCNGFVTTGCLAARPESCDDPGTLSLSAVTTGDTTGAAADYTLSCGKAGGNTGPDLVYRFDFAVDSGVTLRVTGFDSVIELRQSSCESGAVVACSDDEPGSFEVGSRIRVDLLPAGQYFLIVSGFGSGPGAASGSFVLEAEALPGGYERCGDDTVQAALDESCDGIDLDGKDCASFGWDPGGILVCNEVCRGFDFSGCATSAVCPDGQITGPEVCDGAELGGMTCEALGYASGDLGCAVDCRGWDVSACVGHPGCGDGIRQQGEGCDGDAPALFFGLEVIGCHEVGLGQGTLGCTDACTVELGGCSQPDLCAVRSAYGDGACDPCELFGGTTDPDCAVVCAADGTCADVFSPWAGVHVCEQAGLVDPDCGICGDGLAADAESCDGADLKGMTCSDLGFYATEGLGCRPDCDFNVSDCHWCGDGSIQLAEGELCDREDVGSASCGDFGFDGGQLLCNSACRRFDTGDCTTTEVCGNTSVAGPEVCDGDSVSATCESLGFFGGTLLCAEDCLSYDVSGCFGFATCGDGVAVYREICDGDDFNGELFLSFFGVTAATPDCADLELGEGTLSCSPDCTLDISECGSTDFCGADAYDYYSDAICDACSLLGGEVDPACATACQSDGVCADYFDPLTQRRTCLYALGADDPDCRRRCGNGRLGDEEHCDGDDLGGQTCADLGFAGGDLGCLLDCSYDVAGCTP